MANKQFYKKRAQTFQATRKAHSQETAEDYTELIADLIAEKGEARTGDIAQCMGITHVTALKTIRRLEAAGYLTKDPRAPITLTLKGKRTAKESKERHDLLLSFLQKLGVPKPQAEVDVEGIEHHVSITTLRCIKEFCEESNP